MDPLQLTVSFIAILLLAGLAAKLFPESDTLSLASARADYLRFHPGALITNSYIGADHNTVLFPLEHELGVVSRLGDQLVCRTFSVGDVSGYRENKGVITIACNDFTFPDFSIKLDTRGVEEVTRLLESYVAVKDSQHAT